MLKYVEMIPGVNEYNYLRKTLGLKLLDENSTARGLNNSIKCICVYDEKKLIGMGRIIGDNGMVYVISNIFVLPEYQHQGIGYRIMSILNDYLENVASENSQAILMARKDTEDFYDKFGFICRPTNELGAGMCRYF